MEPDLFSSLGMLLFLSAVNIIKGNFFYAFESRKSMHLINASLMMELWVTGLQHGACEQSNGGQGVIWTRFS